MKILGCWAAVSVFLLLHGGQVVSQFGTKSLSQKVFAHFQSFIVFYSSPHWFHWFWPVSSWRMGWSPPLSTTSSRKDRPRRPRPNVVCLAGHLGVFQYLANKVIQSRQGLVSDWSNVRYSTQLLTRVDDCLALLFMRANNNNWCW